MFARMVSLELHVNNVVNAKTQSDAIKQLERVHMVVSRDTVEIYVRPNVTLEHLGKTASLYATVEAMQCVII